MHGLKLVAVAVVAQGVVGMARALAPDRPRALMAAFAAGLVAISGSAWMQLVIVAGGAVLGPLLCREVTARQGETFALHYLACPMCPCRVCAWGLSGRMAR